MWIELTATIVKQRLAGAEFNALKAAALNSGQDADALVSETIARVTNEIRGYVAACSRNVLGESGTIPDELEDAACALFVYRFITRLPVQTLLNEKRTKAYDDALLLLRNVAACKFALVPPETAAPDNEQAGGGNMEVINSRTRTATRADVGGLM